MQNVEKAFLALDIGGTKILAAAVSASGAVRTEVTETVLLSKGPRAFIEQIAQVGSRILKEVPCEAAGISSAGPVDPVSGAWIDATNFKTDGKGWGTVPFRDQLAQAWNLPVFVDNDSVCSAFAEHRWGAGQRASSFAVLTFGTGLGTAVLRDGKPVRAFGEMHAEISHWSLNESDAEAICGCGNTGCAESYLSGTGFARRLTRVLGQPGTALTGQDVVGLARGGHPIVRAQFADFSSKLARYAHDIILAFGVTRFILTGGFMAASPYFLEGARADLERLMARRARPLGLPLEIIVSPLGHESSLLGAAALAQTKSQASDHIS